MPGVPGDGVEGYQLRDGAIAMDDEVGGHASPWGRIPQRIDRPGGIVTIGEVQDQRVRRGRCKGSALIWGGQLADVVTDESVAFDAHEANIEW